MAKQTVALEVLSYHATAQQEETDKLMVRATGWMEIYITMISIPHQTEFQWPVSQMFSDLRQTC